MTQVVAPDAYHVASEVAGSVVELCQSVHGTAGKGKALLYLSSMKMLIDVPAPEDCIVLEWKVKAGDSVTPGQPLVLLKPTAKAGDSPQVAEGPRGALPAVSAASEDEAGGDWSGDLERLRNRLEAVVSRGRGDGRYTIRQRASVLAEPGSLREIGPTAGILEGDRFIPANFMLATGRVAGKTCVIGGEDFTVQGGSPNLPGLRKSRYCEELALQLRAPLVRLHEGAGGSIAGSGGSSGSGRTGINRAEGKPAARPSGEAVNDGHRFVPIALCLETVPVASAVLGSVAGLPAVRVAASHFAVMLEDAALLVAGARVVEQARGSSNQDLSKESIGGAAVHYKTGVVDVLVKSEAEVLEQIRRFLSYMPPHIGELPPRLRTGDDRARRDARLSGLVPTDRQRTFSMRSAIDMVVDEGSFFELKRGMARSLIVGFARLEGHVVGVLANDCTVQGGAMTALAAQKLKLFGEMCERFHIPLVHFVDEPGFMVGEEQEGTLLHGARAAHFAALCKVPTASVLVRRCFGVASYCHFGSQAAFVLAWPSSVSGPMPVQAGVQAAFKRQLEAADDPEAMRRALEARMEVRVSVWPRAEAFGVHDLIDPADTRPRLCEWLESVQAILQDNAFKARMQSRL
eukprot:TRINITY_DN25058_c0_g1_i3.p1 TRINITY_DN25058_c0_g1~~TRINITY_DN25058_c0_g1_i3.p1  ORF type:complete len:630 (-),score=135.46 TRINITY_DN25058_c0_g1_i3:261-2150(-)